MLVNYQMISTPSIAILAIPSNVCFGKNGETNASLLKTVLHLFFIVMLGYGNIASARYVSSDPIGLEGGMNTYVYVYNNPLKYIDPDGLRVTAHSRLIDDWRARTLRARHAWFYYEPDDMAQVQCLLQQKKLTPFQFPMWIGAYAGPGGKLSAFANAPSDNPNIPDPNRISRILQPPQYPAEKSCNACGPIKSDSQFIVDFLSNAAAYDNNLLYNPIPNYGEGYNSNSFAQGLLYSTGYEDRLDVGNTIGSGKPVPLFYFLRQE